MVMKFERKVYRDNNPKSENIAVMRVTTRRIVFRRVVRASDDFSSLAIECPLEFTSTNTISAFCKLMLGIILFAFVPEGQRRGVREHVDKAMLACAVSHAFYHRKHCFLSSMSTTFHDLANKEC
jgi:hypothetical protein